MSAPAPASNADLAARIMRLEDLHDVRLRPRPGQGLIGVLYHVRMDVRIPLDMDPVVKAELVARKKAYA